MKEIKFRVFGTNDKHPHGKMYYPGDLPVVINLFGNPIHAPSGIDIDKCCYMRVGWNDVVLMQYTGMKDKHGKEIYEGDIIKVPYYESPLSYGPSFQVSEEVGEVFWDGEYLQYNVKWDWEDFPGALCENDKEDIEVIGNIYENPKLLEGEDR